VVPASWAAKRKWVASGVWARRRAPRSCTLRLAGHAGGRSIVFLVFTVARCVYWKLKAERAQVWLYDGLVFKDMAGCGWGAYGGRISHRHRPPARVSLPRLAQVCAALAL
jgi:hypothetical protein